MERGLFGGAMVGVLPADAQDMSNLREIPDNQEVFAHSQTDQSIIVEILEFVQETDEQALKTHFEDLASSNEAASNDNSCVLGVDPLEQQQIALTQSSSAYWLVGQQRVSKFKEVAKNEVNVHMVLFRLPQFTSDIVLTFNDPVNVSPESSSHKAVETAVVPWTVEDFRNVVHSLTLVDTGLFG
ncbi:ran guanine nucleotide release factor-like [Littorina saxatilis]|uniref:Ran guanine nucleotide release factor n=1 Tax=Littorina saxatilis TaxID=31220 RepID=A0AAN9AKU5_9CAEN